MIDFEQIIIPTMLERLIVIILFNWTIRLYDTIFEW